MPSLIESLYNGSLFPNEDILPKDAQYRLLGRQITESLTTWKNKLSQEEFEELESLLELYSKTQALEMSASFACGFKMGAALVIEVLHN